MSGILRANRRKRGTPAIEPPPKVVEPKPHDAHSRKTRRRSKLGRCKECGRLVLLPCFACGVLRWTRYQQELAKQQNPSRHSNGGVV